MNMSSLSNKKSPADCMEGQIDYYPANWVSPYDYQKKTSANVEGELSMPNQDTKTLRMKLDEWRRMNDELNELSRQNDELRREIDELRRGDESLKNLITQQQPMCFDTDKMNESSSSKKKFIDIDDADCFGGQAYQGSPSGANTLNLGMQTGTSRGDIDQTAARQLSAIRAGIGKGPQKEIDQNYRKRIKSKLVQGKEISMELQKVKLECEQLKKCSEWFDQQIQKDAKSMEEFQSQISSLISINGSQNQHIHSFFLRLLDMYEENNELKKEIEKKLMTQQQPVGFDTNQLLNLRKPSQRMQTGDEESERYPLGVSGEN